MRIGEGLLNYNRSFEPVARTLKKLAREGLIRWLSVTSTPKANQALPAQVQPASHQRWQSSSDSLTPFL
jgi:hypothetical protein